MLHWTLNALCPQVWVQAKGVDILFRRKVAAWTASSAALLPILLDRSNVDVQGSSEGHVSNGDDNQGEDCSWESQCSNLGSGLDQRSRRSRRLVAWADLDPDSSDEDRLAAMHWTPVPSLTKAADLLNQLQPAMSFSSPDPARLTCLCQQTMWFKSPADALASLAVITADPDVLPAGPPGLLGLGSKCEAAGVVLKLWLGSPTAVRLGLDEHVCVLQLALAEVMSNTNYKFSTPC